MESQALSFTLAPGMAPAAPLMRLLSRFDRRKVEAFAEISIAMLDLMDPDPDLEPNGDELDGSNAEDDYHGSANTGLWSGPGCPISDPDLAADDVACDGDDDREPEECGHAEYGIDQTKGPLPPQTTPDRVLMREHLDRIRRERCDKLIYGGGSSGQRITEYRLRE